MKGKLYENPYVIGAAVAVTSTIIYIVLNKASKKKVYDQIVDELNSGRTNPNDLPQQQVQSLPDAAFPLKMGSFGRQVAEVQQALNRYCGLHVKVDGKLGAETMQSVCAKYFTFCNSSVQIWWANREISSAEYAEIINHTGYCKA